jgi:bifunctional UDP-N-acetylglucosamine pyrophosphorylase / glucosamine-1-phosphate N-acetyltransferase
MMTKPNSNLACIVLAAGEGKRMKSRIPKVLHPLLGQPMGHFSLQQALYAGCDSAVVVVGHGAKEVEASYLERFGSQIQIALQSEQKGTGHAAQMAIPSLAADAERVLIVYGDTPLLQSNSLRDLCGLLEEDGPPLALLTTVLEAPAGYGRIVRDDKGALKKIVEHRDASPEERRLNEVNPGIYVAKAKFLKAALARLSADNAQGEYYLTDIVEMATKDAAQNGQEIPTLLVEAKDTLGVNDREQLAMATAVLRSRFAKFHLLNGVSFADPNSNHIDVGVEIGADTQVGPGVCLYGECRIASDVILHVGSVLTDCVVESGAEIFPYSVCEQARIGKNAKVGPFARLRPETYLEEDVKIGNFVEVKKSHLQRGAKASHLSYLGDAELGPGVNIGAGVITCNYDGDKKHKTQIAEDVFVGSNSTLVAPIKLERGVYVAAGSTLTRSVKADALALARARQDNKEGYALRFGKRKTKPKKAT